ncbi:hypothetical protein NQ314_004941 [Rhamnusium bicolor]|uniref:Uncharacterized protein n=1 Tax=Rhamnusium bicolor TaxID=1586634 RepID=A0AAV8ZKJ3_9CUCU|nr:hypothetical protein NQ314_004941 [Rhamnusium bicolor]
MLKYKTQQWIPPQCVQNAMMTKDKKPFTYTPGGIDLSEVRSPRMARRIERNANLGGADDMPRQQLPPPQNMGPLPPSVQAVMRPQPQVQVFPSGPPPPPSMSRGGAPPPPPPPTNAPPPPPPPPSGPLPTQKVMTSDNQVLERPDMTKIIPDNPMALLRKTGGPQPRRSIVDEIFAQEGKAAPVPTSPPSIQQRPQQFEQQQQRYQPPVIERGAPISPVPQQYQPIQQSQTQPQQYQPPKQQYQPPPPQQRYPEAAAEQPRYQPPIIERQPIPRQNNIQPEVKTSTAHLGSLYIPPANQQQQPQRRVVSPPTPPERNLDSPTIQTPPLKEAPRPWQSKKPQQEEMPPWAKKDNQPPREREEIQNVYQSQSPPTQQQQSQQQRWPQSRPVQSSPPTQQPQHSPQLPGGVPVRIEIRTNTRPAPYQQPPRDPEERKPEAVYITQPIVLQHPGPRIPPQQKQQQQQWQPQNAPQQRVDNQGARVIPVQMEGANQGPRSPATPASDRTLNRQQSWGSNPTQSNSFKIIQKLTQTDDDDEVEDAPITEHAPKYPQNFQQVPADQLRRIKLNEGDQNLMNKFKQVVDDDNSEREVDPRYRGPAIPSKAFKLLQNMTDGSPDPNYYAVPTVSRGPQPQGNKGPQVRTIPVQIEGDDPPQPYVHPSEQVVPEPKKYTGSSIPSRSFKILQAMTAPDNYDKTETDQQKSYLNVNPMSKSNTKQPLTSNGAMTLITPPYPPPPYWHDYFYNYYYQDPQAGFSKEEYSDTSSKTTPRQTPTPRHTPVPFWSYMPPYPYPVPRRPSTAEGESDAETNTNPRSTPLHFYGYGYQYYPESEEARNIEEAQMYPPYPPYFDPYYYSYYYGYPPMYSPYHYYGPTSDTDDITGYSSMDELAYYNKRFTERNSRRNSLDATNPRSVMTPTLNVVEKVMNNRFEIGKTETESEQECSDSESDTETEDDVNKRDNINNPLKSIKSVNNILVYANEDNNSQCSDEVCIEEYSEEGNDDIDEENSLYIVDDDTYPHQLSVIYEESERTDSRLRSASAMSDSTTIAERSEDEEEHSPAVANLNKPFKFCVSITEEDTEEIKTTVTLGDREIKTFEDDNETNPSFTVKSPSLTPTERSLCRFDSTDEANKDTYIINEEDDEKVLTVEQPEKSIVEDDEGKESDESEDWWGIIGKEDDLPKPKPIILNRKHIEASKDQFEEDENSGKLIELESFVAKLEQIQKESGLWNIQLPTKDKSRTVYKQESTKDNGKKEKIFENKPNVTNNNVEKVANIFKTDADSNKDKDCVENRSYKDKESDKSDFYSTVKNEKDEIQTKQKIVSRDEDNDDSSTSYSNYNFSKKISGESKQKKGETNLLQHPLATGENLKILEKAEMLDENIPDIIYPDNNKSSEYKDPVKEYEVSEDCSEDLDSTSSEDESEDHPKEKDRNQNEEKEVQILSIKERIQALKENIKRKQCKLQEEELKNSVKEKISVVEPTSQNRSKTTSTKSSLKSFEEYSEEEEGDSGVTSDMSRHISDNEEFSELKKLTRYQRAATHSRLFKLLQDECENEDDEEEEEGKAIKTEPLNSGKMSIKQISITKEEPPRRDQLSLPLKKTNETESLCSSGINSPGSPVNERLVYELVQSLLKRKKGQKFRNMPKEKLYAAAVRILQEDMDGSENSSEDCSSFLSPLRGSTGYSTAAQTPQEFNSNYDEYKQYYESWSEAEKLYDENYEILPSKAFKLLQEHSNLSKTGAIAGLLAKCPRVLSSKNVHKKLMKLLESSDCPSPTPENPLESNEVTSAS